MDISHRDLKPQNILINDVNDMSSVKLIDFGLGDNQKTNDERCGTYLYMAPEIVKENNIYSKSVDIWAIGIIMHQILTGGKHPYYDHHKDDRTSLIEKLKVMRHVEPSNKLSKLATNLFDRLMAVKMGKRYTARDALQHPWITRQLESDIPMHLERFEREAMLRNKIFLFQFFALLKE